MPARSFMTSADLGISERSRDALITTLVLMERGEIKHVPDIKDEWNSETHNNSAFSGLFNMNIWAAKYECGTVACIGGTAELVGGVSKRVLSDEAADNVSLYNLFFPIGMGEDWGKITVAQAARALSNYLTTGEPNWKEAMKCD